MANQPEEQPVQPFPKALYKAKDPRDAKSDLAPAVDYDNTTVHNEKELKEHLAKGWKTEPPETPEAKAPEHGPKK